MWYGLASYTSPPAIRSPRTRGAAPARSAPANPDWTRHQLPSTPNNTEGLHFANASGRAVRLPRTGGPRSGLSFRNTDADVDRPVGRRHMQHCYRQLRILRLSTSFLGR